MHRLPCALVGLVGAMASALFVGWFEERARPGGPAPVFVPAVVYIADSVGTQTETVLIRALSSGVSVRSCCTASCSPACCMG